MANNKQQEIDLCYWHERLDYWREQRRWTRERYPEMRSRIKERIVKCIKIIREIRAKHYD